MDRYWILLHPHTVMVDVGPIKEDAFDERIGKRIRGSRGSWSAEGEVIKIIKAGEVPSTEDIAKYLEDRSIRAMKYDKLIIKKFEKSEEDGWVDGSYCIVPVYPDILFEWEERDIYV